VTVNRYREVSPRLKKWFHPVSRGLPDVNCSILRPCQAAALVMERPPELAIAGMFDKWSQNRQAKGVSLVNSCAKGRQFTLSVWNS
jgi:hypothetical protein